MTSFTDPGYFPLLYSITPPKKSTDVAALHEIARRQKQTIESLDVDALILYDIQDEKSRTDAVRPFPFLPTLDPFDYSEEFLGDLAVPKIIYRCVGKHSREDFSAWLQQLRKRTNRTVFVGAASQFDSTPLNLSEAYDLRRRIHPDLALGGIAIPERHRKTEKEHLKMRDKQAQGCSFFVTQAVYDVQIAKSLLSDYYYSVSDAGELAPVIFTFSVCGSKKTLDFMKWLGIDFPRWLENDLVHARDIAARSFKLCLDSIGDLTEFSRELGISVGFNIESVSIRKEEIDASVALLRETRRIIRPS